MATPCNSLNVQLIKVSSLSSYSALKNQDLILTIESTGGSMYSRKTTIGDLVDFIGSNPNGSFSGSFTGSFKGRLTGSFYGTASFAKTASYLLQTSQNTTNQLGYFNGTRLTSTPGLVFQNNTAGVKALYISSSLSFNYLSVASRGAGGYNQAGISLANYNSNEPYPSYDSWTLLSNRSGSLIFVAPIGSNQFSSSAVVAKSATGECYGMVQLRNGFYFWPYMSSNTPSRDGGIGIGVQPPTEATGSFSKYLRAKLQINMFSGSGEGPWYPNATVENRATAILVNYGSGSALVPTFYVSSSGNTYIKGKLKVDRGITGSFFGTGFKTLNGKSVSFWGTSSHAVSASFAKTASFFAPPPGASTTLVRKNVVDIDAQGFGGTTVTQAHGCASTPYAFILNWVAKASPQCSFSAGDIASFDDVQYWGNDSDINKSAPGAAVKISGADVVVGWPNNAWNQNAGTFLDDASWINTGNTSCAPFDATKWYLRITFFY